MQFAYTILYVADVPATLSFYEQAFGFQKKFVTPEGDYGELISGATTLAFASIALGNANFEAGYIPVSHQDKPVGMELAFTTENIEADFQRALEAGATEYVPVVQKPWGQQVGYVRDINGFLIEICTPIQAAE